MLENLGIIFGGNSTEHDASIHSYLNVINGYVIKKQLSSIKKIIYIDGNDLYIFTKNFPTTENDLKKAKSKKINNLINELNNNLYWFSLLHGNEGEDGSYQGLSDIFNINGSFGNLAPACLSMHKWLMSEIVKTITKNKILTIPYIKLNEATTREDVEKFIKKTPSAEYIVKPNRLGASLFTKKIKKNQVISFLNSKDFLTTLKYDQDILLQKYIKGREFTIGLLQKKDLLIDLPAVEIFTKNNFLGHKEKHKKGFVKVTFNEIEAKLKKELIENSKLIFQELRFSNFCRFDYILDEENNEIYFLEANSIPGLMSCSIFTRMLEMVKIDIPEMIEIFSKNKVTKIKKKFKYEIE